ncbi:MAG: hypothetical protein ABSE99_02805 [Terracidiphilus sp.]
MGIGPVIPLIPLPASQTVQADFALPPMARVENSARSGDESYSPSGGKSAGGSDGEPEDEFEEQAGDEGEVQFAAQPAAKGQDQQISFFA